MKRAMAYPVVLLLLAVPFARASSVARAQTQVHHTVVAASGDAAPAGGNYARLLSVDMNPRGQVAFDAFLLGPSRSGVFVGDGRTTSTIALGGNPDPAAGNFGFVSNPFITPQGRVVFNVDDIETFRSKGGTAVPLVQDGDPAPGGGTLSPFGGQSRAVNARGTIAFLASVLDSTATQGVFRTDGVHTVAIARDDTAPPTGGTFEFFSTPAINSRGQVAFFAPTIGGTADFGVFRGDGGDLTPVFVTNQVAPGGGIFQDFGDPLINEHGQVEAAASLVSNGAPGAGLFVGDGKDAVAIELEGQAAPKGGTYTDRLFQPVRFNDRGEVAFLIGLRGGTSDAGIFRGDGRHTTTVALKGTIAPGTTGTFASFGDIVLGVDGQVAFIATLTIGVGGVDTTNNAGIWVGRSEADLRLVVRTGDLIGGRALTSLPRQFGQFDIDQNGVAWVGGFPAGATAVILSRIGGADEHDQPDAVHEGQ